MIRVGMSVDGAESVAKNLFSMLRSNQDVIGSAQIIELIGDKEQ